MKKETQHLCTFLQLAVNEVVIEYSRRNQLILVTEMIKMVAISRLLKTDACF